MKLVRVQGGGEKPQVGLLEGEQVWLTGESNPLEVLRHPGLRREGRPLSWPALWSGTDSGYRLLAPIDPPEVWACGFTYQRGPQFSRSPRLPKGPAYTAAIQSDRPEIFFKTTGWRVVGPNQPIGIRGDSHYTAVEAELCLILDENARPVLFTCGNDVSAWDIEARNPLWLAQGKTFEACCALGPAAVTPDELPPQAEVHCTIIRQGQVLFQDSVPLAQMRWSFEELANFAAAFNPLPAGTVLMTGTAIIRPGTEGLAEGDLAEVRIDGIGALRNTGRKLVSKVAYLPYE